LSIFQKVRTGPLTQPSSLPVGIQNSFFQRQSSRYVKLAIQIHQVHNAKN